MDPADSNFDAAAFPPTHLPLGGGKHDSVRTDDNVNLGEVRNIITGLRIQVFVPLLPEEWAECCRVPDAIATRAAQEQHRARFQVAPADVA